MSIGAYKTKATHPEVWEHHIRIQGDTEDLTQEEGEGLTVAWTSTGIYTITWSENPGTFLNATYGLAAATPANIASHTIAFDTYNSTSYTLPFSVYNASDALHDLAANEYAYLTIRFQIGAV